MTDMAKRKRLTPAQGDYLDPVPAGLETKSMGFPSTAPIAQVAGEASSAAALEELAGEMTRAREEGRMIQALPIADIEAGYLTRDRIAADGEELEALKQSIRDRGQQAPIEVVAQEGGKYGLISGWRRLTAIRELWEETSEERFTTILAVLRRPENASDAYVAMVEENEVRLALSHYERARIAAKAVEQGVFESEKQALLQLYSTASRPKRSKIKSFLTIYHAADDLLRFPNAISERLGMALARELEVVPERRIFLRSTLETVGASTADDEVAVLQAVQQEFTQKQGLLAGLDPDRADGPTLYLAEPPTPEPGPGATPETTGASVGSGRMTLLEGVELRFGPNRVELRGRGVTPEFRERLLAWVKAQ